MVAFNTFASAAVIFFAGSAVATPGAVIRRQNAQSASGTPTAGGIVPTSSGSPSSSGGANTTPSSIPGDSGSSSGSIDPSTDNLDFNPFEPPSQCENTCGPMLALFIKAFLDGFDNLGNQTAQNQTENAFCSDDTITKFVTCMDCTIAANSSISQSDAQNYIDSTIAECKNDTGASLKAQTVQAKQPGSAFRATASTGGIVVGVVALAISSLL